jgi:hypothetical protein
MMMKLARLAGTVTSALLYAASATAIAEEKITIIGFFVDEIDVYKDASGEERIGQVSKAGITLPIEVLEVSSNYMLKVDSDKLKGWIYATVVETEDAQFESSDVGPCNHAVPEAYAALRNVGNQCIDD